jgi:hypothetical protein
MKTKRYIAIVAALCCCVCAAGQQRELPVGAKPFKSVPATVERQYEALGMRVSATGKEQTVYAGELVDANGNRTRLQIVHQLPGLVRIDSVAGRRTSLAFDGTRDRGVITPMDEALIETFVGDSVEGLFASLDGNAAVRLLGRRFGPDPRTHPNYKGPRYDIYEVTAPVASRPDGIVRMKFYYFDSETGLLQRTRYDDRSVRPRRKIETRFSAWGRVDGSLYPGRIERYEDGRLVFSFVTAEVAAGPRADPQQFR